MIGIWDEGLKVFFWLCVAVDVNCVSEVMVKVNGTEDI